MDIYFVLYVLIDLWRINKIVNYNTINNYFTGVAKWSHIKQFYELDNNNPNFVFAPCLSKQHLEPNSKQKMRVKLAAQVLSHSVAAGLYTKIAGGKKPDLFLRS